MYGTKFGTLISKFGGKSWDIDIKNMTVSHTRNIACNSMLYIFLFRPHLAAAALVCFFGGVFPAFLAAAAANSLEALGRSVAADPDPVLAFLLPPEVRTGLGLFLRRLPRSESLALLSLKMALKRDTADAAVAFDVAEVAVEGVAVWAGVVGAGVVGADCAGVAGFGVCPPAEDADGVMLPLAWFESSASLHNE